MQFGRRNWRRLTFFLYRTLPSYDALCGRSGNSWAQLSLLRFAIVDNAGQQGSRASPSPVPR
jgi:hypothetical protein